MPNVSIYVDDETYIKYLEMEDDEKKMIKETIKDLINKKAT